MMSQAGRWYRFNALKRWVGFIPPHGKLLGLDATCFGVCTMLSNRSVSEVKRALEIMAELAENAADQDDFTGLKLPPPEFNWELHATGIWLLVSLAVNDPRLSELKVEKWELVTATALQFTKRAADSLCAEPYGLDPSLQVASIQSQMLSVTANRWFVFASLERHAENISTGKKVRASSAKGNQSRHKGDQKQFRSQNILAEANEIKRKNSKLSNSEVAKMIEQNHPGDGDKKVETGYSRRTVFQVISDDSKK